ncbi:hypothetical protein FKM82_005517 [Ascaphus truei]|uniref:cilia- and flagella-associated protein 77 n=1 Tax=Ascaphus truei TaxID=8439 RepID=UPI003F59BBE1
MENERFGLVRDSMQDNVLLRKSELGKTMRPCYALPGPDFIYGQNTSLKEGGVAEAIGHWQAIEARARRRKLERNFVALNREAVKSGLVTAAEHQTYRNTHQIWLAVNEGRIKHLGLRLPPNMTFGITTRPSTPIFDLLENKYQHLWVEQQAKQTVRIKTKEKIKLGDVKDTRTSMLRRYQPPADPAPLWQLPRFQKVGTHLDTFSTQEARQRAFTDHRSNGVARRGLNGQGIYNIS